MRKIYIILYIALATIGLVGCADENSFGDSFQPSPSAHYLYVPETKLSFDADKNLSKNINIESVNTPWRFSGMAEWLTLSPTTGDQDAVISAQATPNLSADNVRTSVFTFSSAETDFSFNVTMSATQSAAFPFINLSESSLEFSGASSTRVVDVTANTAWSATCAENWVKVIPSADKTSVSISVDENLSSSSRDASVLLSGGTSKIITITQRVALITPSTLTRSFENIGGTSNVSFNSETQWTASCSESWIQLSQTSGNAGDATLSITAESNFTPSQREACVFVITGTNTGLTITVTQGGNFITPESESINVSAPASQQKMNVDANVKWTASSNASWLSIEPSTDGKSVVLNVDENTTGAIRTATVSFWGTEATDVKNSLRVTQSAANAPVSEQNTLEFNNQGGSYTINVSSEVAWKAASPQSWIDITPSDGKAGTTAITISVTPNPTEQDRKGNVDISIGGNVVSTISVNQKGNFIELSATSITIAAPASSSAQFEVSSNTDWSVISKPSWITVTPENGTGSKTVTITALENESTSSRTDYIVIGKAGTSLQKSINVTQNGHTFENLIASLSFESKADSKSVEIKTDGTWSAKSNDDWIHVSPLSGSGNSTLIVSVDENTADYSRTGSVDVSVGDITQTIAVTQTGKYITITPTSQDAIPSNGGTHQIHISSNESWTATCDVDWLTLSTDKGEGEIDITLTAQDNPSIYERSATTTFTPLYTTPIKVVTLQAARYLRTNVNQVSFFSKGGTSEVITIDTDASFSIKTSDSWFTVNQNAKTFTVSATDNSTGSTREGKITISMNGLNEGESFSLEIPVVQKARGENFTIGTFGEDENWSPAGKTFLNITINGFGEEEDWN